LLPFTQVSPLFWFPAPDSPKIRFILQTLHRAFPHVLLCKPAHARSCCSTFWKLISISAACVELIAMVAKLHEIKAAVKVLRKAMEKRWFSMICSILDLFLNPLIIGEDVRGVICIIYRCMEILANEIIRFSLFS